MRVFVPLLLIALCATACTGQAAERSQPASWSPAAAGTPSVSAVAIAIPTPRATETPTAMATPSRPPRLGPVPDPWGPAANGLILYGTTAGDIVTMPAAGGSTKTILRDTAGVPVLSPDGSRVLFERTAAGETNGWVANIDGSEAHALPTPDAKIGWEEWAPDSHRVLTAPEAGGDVTILDVDTGSTTGVHAPIPIREASWLPDGRLLVVSTSDPAGPVYATIAENGSGYALVHATNATEDYSLSGDGTRFAYNGADGVIHVVELSGGREIRLTKPDPTHFAFQTPVFSPDGRWVKSDRIDVVGYKVVLVPANGKGKVVELGPEQQQDNGETVTTWAPDATSLIFTCSNTGETWKSDVATASTARVTWPGLGGGIGWQRVEP